MAAGQEYDVFRFTTQIDPALRRVEPAVNPSDIVVSRLGSRAVKDIETRPLAVDGFTD